MKKSPKFKIEQICNFSGRGFVFAKCLDESDFLFKSGFYLGNAKVVYCDIPRLIYDEGKQRYDIWGFNLELLEDLGKFSVGDIVTLSQ